MSSPDSSDSPTPRALGFAFQGFYRHGFQPVGPIFVFHGHTYRAAQSSAMAHAGDNLSPVLFDKHSPAAAIPFLAATQVYANIVFADRQSGWNALQYYYQALSVGLACSGKFDHGNPT